MQRARFHAVLGMQAQATVVAAAVLWAPTALANPSLDTIFSAENALYGAGYDIGRADGWIDQRLRNAIRTYQSDSDELRVSGNLDPETLRALGVSAGANQTVSQNAVGNRSQALKALNLEPARSPEPAPRPQPVEVATPEPAPAPTQASTQVNTPAPAVVPESETTVVAVAEPAPSPEPKPMPEVVAEPDQKKDKVIPEKQVDKDAISNSPDVNTDVETGGPEIAVAEPEPTATPQPEVTPESSVAQEAHTGESDLAASLPTEPTAAGPAKDEPKDAPRTQSGGGFFSSLFDFLFGWLV